MLSILRLSRRRDKVEVDYVVHPTPKRRREMSERSDKSGQDRSLGQQGLEGQICLSSGQRGIKSQICDLKNLQKIRTTSSGKCPLRPEPPFQMPPLRLKDCSDIATLGKREAR